MASKLLHVDFWLAGIHWYLYRKRWDSILARSSIIPKYQFGKRFQASKKQCGWICPPVTPVANPSEIIIFEWSHKIYRGGPRRQRVPHPPNLAVVTVAVVACTAEHWMFAIWWWILVWYASERYARCSELYIMLYYIILCYVMLC